MEEVVLAVHCYSESDFGNSDASVDIDFGGGRLIKLTVPESPHAEWWHVAGIPGDLAAVRIVNRINSAAPHAS